MSKESKVHSIYNVDSDTKSSNYIKIQFKGLIYFELEKLRIKVTSNLTPVKFTSNWWNFELTVFELTVHIKHEIIGMWQRFQRNFELSGTSN